MPTDNGLLDHVDSVTKIAGPLVTVIIGLVIYAWNKMDNNVDKSFTTIDKHAEDDEKIHDILFKEIRELQKELQELKDEFHVLQGEHNKSHFKN